MDLPTELPPPAPLFATLKSNIDVVTRLGALGIGAIYSFGFLIVSLHDASFGVSDFSLVKAKIVCAGAFFAVLVAIPCFAATQVTFRFSQDTELSGLIARARTAIEIFPFAAGTAFFFTFLLKAAESGFLGPWTLSGWILTASLVAATRTFKLNPWLELAASALGSGCLFFAIVHERNYPLLWLGLWFYVCWLATLWFLHRISDPLKRWTVQWEQKLAFSILMLSLFALKIYGTGRPEWGGGYPTHVKVYASPDAPKDLGQSPLTFWLVEQTDHGYYFLKKPTDNSAIYMDRSLVKAAVFDPAQ